MFPEGLFFDVPSNKNYKYCVDNGIANIADFAKRVEKETGVESREAIPVTFSAAALPPQKRQSYRNRKWATTA